LGPLLPDWPGGHDDAKMQIKQTYRASGWLAVGELAGWLAGVELTRAQP